MKSYVYYIPELNRMFESILAKRKYMVCYISIIEDHICFDVVLLGEL